MVDLELRINDIFVLVAFCGCIYGHFVDGTLWRQPILRVHTAARNSWIMELAMKCYFSESKQWSNTKEPNFKFSICENNKGECVNNPGLAINQNFQKDLDYAPIKLIALSIRKL